MSHRTEKIICLVYATLILGLGAYAGWKLHHPGSLGWAIADLVSDACVIGWIVILLDIDNAVEGPA